QGDALHLDHDALRRPRPRRLPRHLRLLLQGRDPRLRHRPRWRVHDLHRAGLLRRPADRRLHLPADLPRPPRQALRGGPGADRHGARPPRAPLQPGDRRRGGHRRRLPGLRAPHRRADLADAGGDGCARLPRPVRRPGPGAGAGRDDHPLPRPGLRGLAAGSDRALGRRLLVRPGDRRRDLPRRHRRRLLALHPPPGDAGGADPPARAAAHLPLQQVVLRRADRLPHRPPGTGCRPLRQPRLRALRRRRPGQRHRGRGRGHRPRRPRRPERLRPQLRAAAARRLRRARPLLPPEQLMINSLLWTPLAFGIVGLFLPKRVTGWWATLGAVVTLGIAVGMALGFDSGSSGLQYSVDTPWISGLGVDYSLGIDGLNLFLILLTAVLWIGGIAFAAFRQQDRPQLFFLLMLVAETATLGSFLAQDLLLFVLFFDFMLVPFYFLFGSWGSDREGGPTAAAATLKMMIFTLIGSLLMLVGAIAAAIISADGGHLTFSIAAIQQQGLDLGSQRWIFWFFAAAFLVKMPAFLLHGWMPDAYRAAPLPVLVVFSGVLAKVGAYGFLRVVLPLFPDATVEFQEVI